MAVPATSSDSLTPAVELFLEATELPNMDRLSKTDGFAVLFRRNPGESPDTFVLDDCGRTETVRESLNPRWTTQFVQDYFFEEFQEFTVRVFDDDKRSFPLIQEAEFIGEATFTLGAALKAKGTLSVPLEHEGAGRGTLTVHANIREQSSQCLRFKLHGQQLANKDGLFSQSDPYIKATRAQEDGTFIQVWQSETIDNNLNPEWAEATISLQALCNTDVHCPIRWEIWDWDRFTAHDFMGSFDISPHDMVQRSGGEPIPVVDRSKGRDKEKHAGSVLVDLAEFFTEPSMMDFIRGGLEISMTAAIDLTESNGEPQEEDSLHHVDSSGSQRNHYEQAMEYVGRVLEQYDSNKRWPVLGFGARKRTGGGVDHCMPLNNDSEVYGVQGMLNAYHAAMSQVEFAGPTLLNRVLRHTMENIAQCSQEEQRYHVLLVICDGVINDMDATVDALVEASRMPLSVILVGVGTEDFTDMNRLAGEMGTVTNTAGEEVARDIVQFVKMSTYTSGSGQPGSRLSSDILREIPRQLTSYMSMMGITPNPPN